MSFEEPKFRMGDIVLYSGMVFRVESFFVMSGIDEYMYAIETFDDPPGAPTACYQARESNLRKFHQQRWDEEAI